MDDKKNKLGKIPKMVKIVVTILILLGGGYWWFKEPDITPDINPNPTVFFTINGEFPFDKGYRLSIYTSYLSSNPDCQKNFYVFGIILANSRNRGWDVETEIVHDPENPNKFTAKIYKDLLSPGHCGWKIISVENFTVKSDSELDKALLANPEDLSRAQGFMLAQKEGGWAELKLGDIDFTCKSEKRSDGRYDGLLICERDNQSKVYKMPDAEASTIPIPSNINVKYTMEDY